MSSNAQSVKKVLTTDLIRFANNQVLVGDHKTENLFMRVYKVADKVIQYAQDTDIVDHDIYFAVSEYDEQSKMNLFKIGAFFYPISLNWTIDKETGTPRLDIEGV